jgi:hypothetical protein
VAVLRLHAAVTWLRNDYNILAELYERITQLQYLSQVSSRTSENSVRAKFAEWIFHVSRETQHRAGPMGPGAPEEDARTGPPVTNRKAIRLSLEGDEGRTALRTL